MSLRLRRGTDAERQTVTFLEGELVYTTDTKKVFVGDGATLGGVAIDSALGSIGTLTDVDIAGVALGQTLQWDGTAFVPGSADKESLYGTDSTILVDAINSSINLNGTVKGDIIPDSNIAYDIGSAAARFRDLYLSGTTIDLGGTTISTSGGKVNFSTPVQAEFELNQNMDLKNYYVTSTDATPDVSLRPGAGATMNVATTGGTKLFEVDLDTNTYGTPNGQKTVLQLPVFQSVDYTNHSGDVEAGQIVFDNQTKTLKIYNGTAWVQVSGSGGGGGIVEGGTYDINITGDVLADDSSVMVNTLNKNITGNFIGDITSSGASTLDDATITGGNIDGTPIGANVPSTIRGTTITASTEFVGDLTGDSTGFHTGDVTGNLTGNAAGDHTGTFIGTITATGTLDGDVSGSIFAQNSTLLIDGINAEVKGRINTDLESYFEGPVNFGRNTSTNHKVQYFSTTTNGVFSDSVINVANIHNDATYCNELGLFRARGTVDAQTSAAVNDLIGTLSWAAYDGSTPQIANAIKSQVTSISANNVTADLCIYTRNGLIGTFTKKLTIQGSTGGGMVSEAFIQFGSYTTTERDALTAANGMVLYNETTSKFQGYAGGAWVDLH